MFHSIALITIVGTQFEMNEMEEHTTDSFQILLQTIVYVSPDQVFLAVTG